MKRAIVSGVSGDEWIELAGTTWPRMAAYAESVGATWLGLPLDFCKRPKAWGKLVLIAEALVDHDEVLWLDADVSTSLATKDIFRHFPPGPAVAMCRIGEPCRIVHLNSGVMIVRRSFLPWLVRASMEDDCILHPWWEQEAINRFDRDGLISVHELSEEWNFWEGSSASVKPQFLHACGIREQSKRLSWLNGEGLCGGLHGDLHENVAGRDSDPDHCRNAENIG